MGIDIQYCKIFDTRLIHYIYHSTKRFTIQLTQNFIHQKKKVRSIRRRSVMFQSEYCSVFNYQCIAKFFVSPSIATSIFSSNLARFLGGVENLEVCYNLRVYRCPDEMFWKIITVIKILRGTVKSKENV